MHLIIQVECPSLCILSIHTLYSSATYIHIHFKNYVQMLLYYMHHFQLSFRTIIYLVYLLCTRVCLTKACLHPWGKMIFEVFGTIFTYIYSFALEPEARGLVNFLPSCFNFCMVGLNLGRWVENEQARRKFTRPLNMTQNRHPKIRTSYFPIVLW